MAGPLNHVVIAMPRNGTSSFTVDPATASGGTVVGGATFAPTSGRMLVCGAYGAITLGGTSGLNATPPTGWTKPGGNSGEAVNNGGLYVWYRTASATTADRITAVANGSDYPAIFEFWEFEAGTTWSGQAFSVNVASGGAGPSVASLTGTNWTCGLLGSCVSSGTGTGSVTWAAGVEQVESLALRVSTDGYLYSSTAIEDDTATSRSIAATFTAPSGSPAERIMFAVKVATASGPTAKPGSDAATVTDTATETATAARTDAGALTDSQTVAASETGADTATVTDASTPANLLALLDAATVGDTITVAPAVPVADAATVTDTRSSSATAALVDSGALVDASSTAATLARTDTGAVADASSVSVAGVTVSAVDAGALTELAVSTAVLALADLTALAELVALAGTDTSTDAGTLTDASTVAVAGTSPAVTDSTALAEAVLLSAVLAAADVSVVAELFTVTASDAVVDAAVLGDTSGLSASAFRAVADAVTLAELVATTAGGAVAELLTIADEPLLVLATLAGVDAATMAELGLVGLPAADVPPLLVVATGRDQRWRAVGRVLQRYAASGRGGRYSARGIEGS